MPICTCCSPLCPRRLSTTHFFQKHPTLRKNLGPSARNWSGEASVSLSVDGKNDLLYHLLLERDSESCPGERAKERQGNMEDKDTGFPRVINSSQINRLL